MHSDLPLWPETERISELLESGKYTHVLDITQACHAVCAIAESERNHSDMDVCKQFKAIADRWSEVFDTALCGSKDVFGYGKAAVSQCDVPDRAGIIAERALHRFDGANNEHDMESPYVYNYADRHDRTCEVVRSIMKYMFAEGTGGLPGNNDSGALSSWYVWNAMGLFPVSGQNTILIGSPIIENAVLNLSNGRTLEISVSGDGINVQKAIFNGRELENFSLTVQELMTGGRLEMIMCFL